MEPVSQGNEIENQGGNKSEVRGEITSQTRSTLSLTANELYEMFTTPSADDGLKINLPFQRRAGVWKVETERALILSMLINGHLPELLFLKENLQAGGFSYNVLDGQQRLTTVFTFMEDEFKLGEDAPNVVLRGETHEVYGKKFSELDEACKDKVKNYMFRIQVLDNYTYLDAELAFIRVNSGVPLSIPQKTKASLGEDLTKYIGEQLKAPFFKEHLNSTDAARKNEIEWVRILQMMIVLDKMYKGREYKNIKEQSCLEYAVEIRDNYSNTQREILSSVVVYLSEVFEEKFNFLKSTNVAVTAAVASVAIAKGVQPTAFKGFMYAFGNDVLNLKLDEIVIADKNTKKGKKPTNQETYKLNGDNGGIIAKKVNAKLDAMLSEFCNYFRFKLQEVKDTTGDNIPALQKYFKDGEVVANANIKVYELKKSTSKESDTE